MSHRYVIYGECLESEIEFPELRPAPADLESRWRFGLDASLPSDPPGELLGEEHIYGDVSARLLRDREGAHWIRVPDTGTYRMSPEGHSIRWRPNEDPWWDFGRAHLMGRVLATAMHLDGILTLHGSGVELSEGAIAFLAPKNHGKSTLALSLTGRGARLLTDDAFPVDPPLGTIAEGEAPLVRPGVHSVRLTPESRARLGVAEDASENREGKVVFGGLPEERLVADRVPLAAAYLLKPVRPDPGIPAATRRELGKVEATLALNGQQKMAEMLGPGAALELLDRAAAIAERIPVYSLEIVRDFERLDEALDRILEWHPLPAGAGSAAAGTHDLGEAPTAGMAAGALGDG